MSLTTPALADQAARDRIASDLDHSLLIEAGAGTGKTTALVERVATLLSSGHATVDDLAVVTFTRDAAAELTARVRERLEVEATGAADPEARQRLDAALRGLYRARISTLHVFAATLLRERPVEARVDPGLKSIDELERGQRFEASYGAWLEEVLSREDEALRLALNRGLQLKHLEQLCRLLDVERAAFPLEHRPIPPVDHAAFRHAIAGHAMRLAELEPRCNEAEDRGIAQHPLIVRFAAAVAAATDGLALERLVLERPPKLSRKAGAQTNWDDKEDCKAWKQELGDLDDAITAYVVALRGTALAGMLPLAESFVTRFAQERREDGVADFDDLLLWSRDLLKTDVAARRWLRERYRHVLVDEFQDTDPLQAEIALLLTSADDGTWESLRPAPGALVVVGDPKQSIYRFRRADIATYDTVKAGPLQGRDVALVQNFRSVGDIIDWVNRVFTRVFAAGRTGEQAAHVDLVANRPARVRERAAVVLVPDPGARGEKLKADAYRLREADLLARTLRLAIEAERWTVGDGNGARAAVWSDVAVLLPTRTSTAPLLDAFDRHGVPYRADRGEGLFQQPEIAELVAILRAIDDPTDAVHVAGALRSDAFGASVDDLATYAALGGRFDPRFVLEDGPTPVVEGLRTLATWRSQRRGLSLAELVSRVLDQSGMIELALEGRDGAQTAGNLLRVVEEARTFAGTGGGLRAFTRWLADRRETDTEAAEAGIADPRDPVVRVMTIHGAKGLEFPIVALAGLDAAGKNGAPAVIARRDEHRIALKLPDGFETPDYAELAEREQELLALEKDRLLYVAVTRAEDHLVIPAVRDPAQRKGLLARLTASLPEDGPESWGRDVDGVHVLDPRTLPEGPPIAPVEPAATEAIDVDALVAAEDAWIAGRRESRARAAAGVVQTIASSVQPIDRIRPLAATDAGGDDSLADLHSAPPVSVGTALHHVMDTIALDGSEDPVPLVRAACLEAGIPGAESELAELVRACLGSDAVQRAAASDSVYREVPFTVPAPAGGYAVGRADLVFRDGDGLVVVDYKSDTVADASTGTIAQAGHVHSGQGLVYAAALAQATGLAVREVVFVFARAGGAEYRVVVDDEAAAAGRELLGSGRTLGVE